MKLQKRAFKKKDAFFFLRGSTLLNNGLEKSLQAM